MSVYHGPRLRLMRAVGVELPGLSRKTTERRPHPPGQHGPKGARRKLSTFGLQLREKQKLRYNYGITEKQLRRYVEAAARQKKERPGNKLLQLLESRLDSVVFRSGFAPTIPAARQLVSHGHVLVNGKKVDIASYIVRAGEELTLSTKAQKLPVVVSTMENLPLQRPTWLGFDSSAGKAKVERLPDRESFPFEIQEMKVIEYYSQRV